MRAVHASARHGGRKLFYEPVGGRPSAKRRDKRLPKGLSFAKDLGSKKGGRMSTAFFTLRRLKRSHQLVRDRSPPMEYASPASLNFRVVYLV